MSFNNEADITKRNFVIINNQGVAHVFGNTEVKPVVYKMEMFTQKRKYSHFAEAFQQ